MDDSHKYRMKIRDQLAQTEHLSEEDRNKMIEEYRDADFWLTKGISTAMRDQHATAIQCYKQALLLNPDHYLVMFNIACSYERFSKFSCAFKWFKRAV